MTESPGGDAERLLALKMARHDIAHNPTDLSPYAIVCRALLASHAELTEIRSERDRWQARAEMHERKARDEYWIWQGDGEDEPESLACPVLIHQDALRTLVAAHAELERARAEVEQLKRDCGCTCQDFVGSIIGGCKRHGCRKCGMPMLADTEEWKGPLCNSCFEALTPAARDALKGAT